MDENREPPATFDFRRLFLWTHLFRAFRIAFDIRKALLAAIAIVAVFQGNKFISSLPFAADEERDEKSEQVVDKPKLVSDQPAQKTDRPLVKPADDWFSDIAEPFSEPPLRNPMAAVRTIAGNARLVFEPLLIFVRPARELLETNTSFANGTAAWTRLLWTMLVWGLFGGAVTRMAAVEFATDERLKLRSAVRFAATKILSFFGAPLLPLLAILLFWLLGMLAGLIGRIPEIGEMLLGIGFVIPLVFGLVTALILLAVAVGWPLMYPTISAEGSDAFDGLSRSFSYIFGRIWHYLWYGIVALAYGYVVVGFVFLVGSLLVHLTAFSLAAGMGVERVASLLNSAPALIGGPETLTPLKEISTTVLEKGGDSIGLHLAGLWLHLLALLMMGFVYSYFWSAATIIYFLLRKVDDATALDEIYLEASDQEDEMLPLVGVAASEQPVIERPANVEGINEQADRESDDDAK